MNSAARRNNSSMNSTAPEKNRKDRGMTYTRFPLLILAACMAFGSTVSAQDDIPELDLQEYQIVGRDTRVFQITGDKIPTIAYVKMPMPLPEEVRANESSEAIIPEDERLWRLDSFEIEHHPYTRAEVNAGSKVAADLWGRGSLDFTSSAATLDVISRGAKQNTPSNLPPTSQRMTAIGYRDVGGARLMGGFSFRRDREDLLTTPFRSRDRAADMYDIDASLRTTIIDSWDAAITATVSSGAFSDKQRGYDDDELVIGGGLTTTGDLYGLMSAITGAADYVSFGDDNGSKLSAGIAASWLPWSQFSIRFGANTFIFAMPGDDAKLRVYPEAGIDWRISRPMYAKLYFKPEVITHSYADIYMSNALALPTPVIYEDRSIDTGGEIGIDLSRQLRVIVGGFVTQSDHRPVFSSDTGFFPVLRNEHVDITGFRAGFQYAPQGKWSFDGEYRHRDVSWDSPGGVPYEPADLAVLNGRYIPAEKWRVYGAAHYYGSHFILAGSTATTDPFVTIDIGAARELWSYLSVYTEVKNLTNSDGAWWTTDYGIPGIGIYAGLRAGY